MQLHVPALAMLCLLLICASFGTPESKPVAEKTWAEDELLLQVGEPKSVNGGELGLCSTSGMAMTGFTRSGKCEDEDDDAGSHHICIDLQSTSDNFCKTTGQSDWCDDNGECFQDDSKQCPRKHWCVCQWAFAGYLAKAGGCDKIQTVVCTATNMAAMTAYEKKKDEDEEIKNAYDCLKSKCSIN